MSTVEQLSDGTVWLTVPAADDIDAITAACADPSIGEWTTVPVPYTRADAEEFVGAMVPRLWEQGSPTWAVRTEPGGVAVGMIGLVVREPGVGEVGFWLAPWARSRGLAGAALRLTCRNGFAAVPFDRIEWRAYVGNHASAAVARNAGFHYEGLLRLGVRQREQRRDCWLASLLPGDELTRGTGWPAGV